MYYNMAVAHIRLKRYAEGIFELEHYLELKPAAENWDETERIIEQLREKLQESD